MRCSGKIYCSSIKQLSQVANISFTTRWLSFVLLWKKSSLVFSKPRRRTRVQRCWAINQHSRAFETTIVYFSTCQRLVHLSPCSHPAALVSVLNCAWPRLCYRTQAHAWSPCKFGLMWLPGLHSCCTGSMCATEWANTSYQDRPLLIFDYITSGLGRGKLSFKITNLFPVSL